MDPFTDVSFSPAPCLPCCTPAAGTCSCTLLIPPETFPVTPYVDYSTAAAAITAYVASCIAYSNPIFTNDTFSADDSTANTLVLNSTNAAHFSARWYSSLNLKAGAVAAAFSITSSDTGGSYTVNGTLYNCADFSVAGTDSVNNSLTGSLSFTVPADGEYILYLNVGNLE